MKKLLSIITVLVIVFLSFNIIAVAEEAKNYGQQGYIKFFYDLEIFDAQYNEDDPLTRAELAEILTRLLKYDNSLDSMRGVSYKDVSVDYYASKSINFMNVMGIMNGKGVDMFYPEDDVTLGEAAASIVRLLGYSAKAATTGGYAAGYILTANDLGALRGVPDELCKDYLGAGALARMLFNVLEVNMVTGYIHDGERVENVGNITLLKDYLELEKGYGLLSGVNNLFLVGNTNEMLPDNEVRIGNERYITNNSDIKKYFGCYIDFYYKKELTQTAPVIYSAFVNNNVEEVRINGSDIKKADNTSIEYLNSDSDKKVNYKIKTGAVVLYNGKVISKMDNQYVPKNGYIKLISNFGSGYDVIIIFDYQSFVVKSQRNGKIYFEYGNTCNGNNSIDLGAQDVTSYITYENKVISPTDIRPGDAVSIASYGNNYYVEVSRKQIKGVLRSREDSPLRFYIKGEPYEVNDKFYTLTENNADGTSKLELGISTTFYLDVMNKIIGMDFVKSGMIYGYLQGVLSEGVFDSNVKVRIFDSQTSEFTEYNIPEKCYLNGKRVDSSVVYNALVSFINNSNAVTNYDDGEPGEGDTGNLLAFQPSLTKYQHDGQGNITHIVTDVRVVSTSADKQLEVSDDYILISGKYGGRQWLYDWRYFSSWASDLGTIYCDNVGVIKIPVSGDEEEFKAGNSTNNLPTVMDESINVIIYDLDFESGVPGYIAHISTGATAVSASGKMYGVVSVSKGIDCAYIETYDALGNAVILETTDDNDLINTCSAFEEGDIIQCSMDGSGKVGRVEKLFSYYDTNFDLDFYTKADTDDTTYNFYERLSSGSTQAGYSLFLSKVNKVKTDGNFSVINFNLIDNGTPGHENIHPGTGVNLVQELETTSVLIYDGKNYYKGTAEDIEAGDYVLGISYGRARIYSAVVFKDAQYAHEFHICKLF